MFLDIKFFQFWNFQMSEKMALFIDGQSLHYTAKALGFDIDFKRLLEDFGWRGFLLRAYYYAQVREDPDANVLRPLLDWLAYNGFVVRQTISKDAHDTADRRKFKRNIGVNLAVDALELAPSIERMFLFAGDSDLATIVRAVQRRGVHVTVVSTMAAKPQVISEELRRSANSFLDLGALRAAISRREASL